MAEHVRTEWRVTGQPNSVKGMEFPPYTFVWRDDLYWDGRSRRSDKDEVTAEQAARNFCAKMTEWEEGPFLHKRTVTTTDWEGQAL